jgi:hypothetical protein
MNICMKENIELNESNESNQNFILATRVQPRTILELSFDTEQYNSFDGKIDNSSCQRATR